jgi:hypothetical protein
MSDLKFAVCQLLMNLGFAFVALLTLAPESAPISDL